MADYIDTVIDFHGVKCIVANNVDDKYYKLIALEPAPNEVLKNDNSFTQYSMWVAVAKPVTCPACGSTSWIDDTNIMDGVYYEICCPTCKCLCKRRK